MEAIIDPHFFFEGKLSREEAVSAFLATLLEQQPLIREGFLSLLDLPNDELNSLLNQNWKRVDKTTKRLIETEKKEIDICINLSDFSIIIENKIKSGAQQKGQLRRYYKKVHRSKRPVIVIILSPLDSSIGNKEIILLEQDKSFREGDKAFNINWKDLIPMFRETTEKMHETDKTWIKFIQKGTDCVEKLLQQKHPIRDDLGVQERFKEIIKRAGTRLTNKYKNDPYIVWGPVWPHWHDIYIAKNTFTIDIGLDYHEEREEKGEIYYYPRSDVLQENGKLLKLIIIAKCKISGVGKSDLEVNTKWREIIESTDVSDGKYYLPSIGTFSFVEKDWLEHRRNFIGNDKDLEKELISLMENLINHFRPIIKTVAKKRK